MKFSRFLHFLLAGALSGAIAIGSAPTAFADEVSGPETSNPPASSAPAPVSVSYPSGDSSHYVLMYELAGQTEAEYIATDDFEYEGETYRLLNYDLEPIVDHQIYKDGEEYRETKVGFIEASDPGTILGSLPETMEYVNRDGFSGILEIQPDSLSASLVEGETLDVPVTIEKQYEIASDMDNMNDAGIPETITEDGIEYTRAGVNYEMSMGEGKTTTTAIVTYTGMRHLEFPDGNDSWYVYDVAYAGQLAKDETVAYKCVVTFAPADEVEAAQVVPPEAQDPSDEDSEQPETAETGVPAAAIAVTVGAAAGVALFFILRAIRRRKAGGA